MAIDVGTNGLIAAYEGHRDRAGELKPCASSCLLLAYAIECGLKAALLRRQSKRHTGQLASADRTHDLRHLIRQLRIPRSEAAGLFGGCVLSTQRPVSPGELHEVWRYGSTLRSKDQGRVEEDFTEILKWLREELRR